MLSQISGSPIRDYLLRFGAIFAILFTPFYNFYGDRLQPIPLTSLAIAALYFALASAVLVLLIRRNQGFPPTADYKTNANM
jgi:ABC-type Fe3+-siderophore transport system permease subunit